jgi:hypothetical protein
VLLVRHASFLPLHAKTIKLRRLTRSEVAVWWGVFWQRRRQYQASTQPGQRRTFDSAATLPKGEPRQTVP